jgi:hypothetical protein
VKVRDGAHKVGENPVLTREDVMRHFAPRHALLAVLAAALGPARGAAHTAPALPLTFEANHGQTCLGGSGKDHARGVALDATGHVFVAGSTGPIDFPTVSPLQARSAGALDAFVARLTVGPEVVVRITASQGEPAALTVTLANGGAVAEDVELKVWRAATPGYGVTRTVKDASEARP